MDLEDLLQEALSLGEEGDWAGMAEQLRGGLEAFNDSPALLCWLGVAEREMGLAGVPYERFKAALALQPDDPHVLATVGNGLARFDDAEAEAALRAAAIMAPDLPLTRWMYGAYLAREGLFPDALRELEAALELSPDHPAAVFEMGVALALAGRMEEALHHFGRAVDLDPESGWNQMIMGLVEVELDQMEEANRDLSSAARLRPLDLEAQLLASLAARVAGWEDLAYEMLERARQTLDSGDLPLLDAVEVRLEEDEEAAKRFLVQEVMPAILRERLMVRP